jgi:sigma-E factor negative regulatory protein RseB
VIPVLPVAPPPRYRLLGALLLAAGVTTGVALPGGSPAAVAQVPSGPPVSDGRAGALLRTAYDAGQQLHYSGDAFVGVGGSYQRVHVSHVPGKGTFVSATDMPVAAAPTVVQPDVRPPAANPDPTAMLEQHYRLAVAGTGQMAGRAAYVVQAVRSDASVAAKFWIDRRTSLLLGRAGYDADGHEYTEFEFTSLQVAGSPPVVQSPVFSALGALPGGLPQVYRLRLAGWHVPATLPGDFDLYDARVISSDGREVLHLSYSDGLCSLSLFEEAGVLRSGALAGWQRASVAGRTVYVDASSAQRLVWQGGDTVYALLGDAAPARVADAVAALPGGAAHNGLLDRMGRGLRRLSSWLDPLG